jgi:hypothetical protein
MKSVEKYQNPDPETWVVYSKIPKHLWNEFRDAGLVSKIDDIVKTAMEDAIYLEKRGK